MNIVYLHQYFYFPNEYGATRSYWITKELAKNNSVTVITSKSSKQEKLIQKVKKEGIEVIYIKVPYDNKMSPLKRVFAFIRFMLLSSFLVLKLKKVDLIYATSTPLTIAVPALLRRYLRKTPYIFEVRDLWPEFPIQIGAIKNKIIIRFLRWIEKLAYDKSIHIVALSPGMKQGVMQAGVPEEKISMIPNMSKPDLFFPRKKNEELANKCRIELSKFNLIHFGAMGVANGLDYVLEVAQYAKNNNYNDFTFVFLGDGYVKESLVDRAQKEGLDNVLFIGKQNLENTSEIVNLCDVSLVSFKELPVLQTNSPNKMFDSFSAGKPVIVNSQGWTRQLVETYECGFYCNPAKPEELIQHLELLKKDQVLYQKQAKNARDLSLSKFDKKILTQKISLLVESLSTS